MSSRFIHVATNSIYLKELKSDFEEIISTAIFIAPLFAVAKIQKQPK
jgi:hypothetical protein